MMKHINSVRNMVAYGFSAADIVKHMSEQHGVAAERTMLLHAAAKVLQNDSYVCKPDRGNRKESCVQIVR